MAKCPKCGKNLHLFNLSQYCPHCGTNVFMYGFEENFFREAKIAELSNAVWSVRIRHLKAAFIGSKLTILRLVAAVISVATLLAPVANYSISLPYNSVDSSVSGLGIYGIFSNGALNYIMTMCSSELFGPEFTALRNLLFAFASSAIVIVVILFTSVLCFISYKKMQKITMITSIVGFADCIAVLLFTVLFLRAVKNSTVVTGSFFLGPFVLLAGFAFVFVINLLLVKKGIPVDHAEGSLERLEIYKKVKRGEINIDDLPQPVVETEETRKIEAEIAKAQEGLAEAEKSGRYSDKAPVDSSSEKKGDDS